MVDVEHLHDPGAVLRRAGGFLAADPIRNNLILTLLETRARHREPGRYWVTSSGDEVTGVVFQSPLSFSAAITPMTRATAVAVVDAIVDDDVELPGVMGEPAATAAFAGHWTERTRLAAAPTGGQRLYEIDEVIAPRPAPGTCAVATAADRDLLVHWFTAFATETGGPRDMAATAVDRRLPAGEVLLWHDGEPVAMTAVSAPVAGVARIAPVYTPPARRGRGYASNLVAEVSRRVLASGNRCMLYTDLGSPTPNAVYRALGYRAVDEAVRYAFLPPHAR